MKALAIPSSTSSSTFLYTNTRTRVSIFSSLKLHHQLVSFPLAKLHSLHFTSLQRCYPISPSSLPESQTDLELDLAETFNQDKYESKTVRVKFQLKKKCSFGEQFAIVGDDLTFGFWVPDNAIPLNWSDDHVWNLELDVPIGKSIQFKFILKEITGSILWQPGPDRILKTWETNNTILVSEDWEDASSQKLLEEEEEPVSNENVDPDDNSQVRFIAGDLRQQNASDVNKEKIIPDVQSNPEKEPLPSIVLKSVIAETAASSEEKAISLVADNISNSNEEPAVDASHQVLKDEHEADSNKDGITFDKILEENVMIEEGDPVLVLGLDYCETEADGEGLKSRSAFDASAGVNEVENHNSQEKAMNIEIEEKHNVDVEVEVDPHESEMVEENEENGAISNKIVENDIQWGRRTIQRLLTNLGLLYQ